MGQILKKETTLEAKTGNKDESNIFVDPITNAVMTKDSQGVVRGAQDMLLIKDNNQYSLTGTTLETQVFSAVIPANSLGPNGILEILLIATYVNSANIKSIRVKLNGNTVSMLQPTTTQLCRLFTTLHNRGAQNVNFIAGNAPAASNYSFGTSNNAITTFGIDFSQPVILTVTLQSQGAAETTVLESILVKGIY